MNAPPPRSPLSPEAQLTQHEAEASAHERRLADSLQRAEQERAQLERTLTELRERLQHAGDLPTARDGLARISAAELAPLPIEEPWTRARRAREEALAVRRASAKELEQALLAFERTQAATRALATETERALTEAERIVQADLERTERQRAEETRREQERKLADTQISKAPGRVPPPPTAPAAEGAARPRNARVAMQTAIDLRSDSNFFTGFSTNLSEGGVFIATVQASPVGTPVDLTFTLPGGAPIQVKGVVRWTREVNDRTPELMPGIGVQFLDLAPHDAQAITGFVQRREPLFFPD